MVRSKSWKRSKESFTERRIERPALLIRMSTWPCLSSTVLAEAVAVGQVGDVAGIGKGAAALLLDLGHRLVQLCGRARRQDHHRAGGGQLERAVFADARTGTRHHHHLVAHPWLSSRARHLPARHWSTAPALPTGLASMALVTSSPPTASAAGSCVGGVASALAVAWLGGLAGSAPKCLLGRRGRLGAGGGLGNHACLHRGRCRASAGPLSRAANTPSG